MHLPTLLTAGALSGAAFAMPQAAAKPFPPPPPPKTLNGVNPFVGKEYFVPAGYGAKLEDTIKAFKARNDTLNAARTRTVQRTSTFSWVTTISAVKSIPGIVAEARAAQRKTKRKQVVQLVLYNLPDRDCSAGESAGELSSAKNGLQRYKTEFIDAYAAELKKAADLDFVIAIEPDSVGNLITNQAIEFCKNAGPVYKAGIAYAIAKLQLPNVALYLDAAHGQWLGWQDNLAPTAAAFAEIVGGAQNITRNSTIRGFVTNVSNYNQYNMSLPHDPCVEWNPSFDESHYASSLGAEMEKVGLPAHFIVDQGRVVIGNRTECGSWCNVSPAGFGQRPTTNTNSSYVDSIVWVKPGGESDGACGLEGAPAAGAWFEKYVEMLVEKASPPLEPTWK